MIQFQLGLLVFITLYHLITGYNVLKMVMTQLRIRNTVVPPDEPVRKITFPTERFQPRRLLKAAASSLTSLSTDPSKLKGAAMNEPQTSVEDSLRKRPPSASNPSHN
ncbi:hypothetical protein L2E82_32966 [Cichorium intybus]|uniref:Uncharacterized protein n=1 Tax=Cichorium intybus TaxID=13427 RepID=A0ACB9BIU6_CICIN|nr:hypothetical protein L2E82_32966 [Cichorium intybus]